MISKNILFALGIVSLFLGIVNAVPTGITSYISIVLNNSQSISTPIPYQDMVNITESSFVPYIAYNNNFANFEYFYVNGTVIPAWIESNSSGKIITWLNIKGGIPASSSITVYLGFASTSTNLLSNTGTSGIGEAPQLSSTYGQYDNGASVFPILYENFIGTATPTGWSCSLCTINNGAQANFGDYLITTASYGLSANQIYDELITTPASTGATSWYWTGYVTSGIGAANIGNHVSATINGGPLLLSVAQGSASSAVNTTFPVSTTGIASLYWASSSEADFYYNYGGKTIETTDVPSSQTNLGIANNQGAGTANLNIILTWLRTRAYPPSGVMPTTTFGAVQIITSITTIPSNNNEWKAPNNQPPYNITSIPQIFVYGFATPYMPIVLILILVFGIWIATKSEIAGLFAGFMISVMIYALIPKETVILIAMLLAIGIAYKIFNKKHI